MPYGSGNCVRQMALRLSTSPGSREAVLCEWFGANKDLNEKPFSIVLPNSVFPFDEVTDVAVSRNCQMLNYFYNLNRDAQRVVSKTRDLDAGVDWINHYLRTDLGEFAYPYQRLLTDTARSVAEHWEPSACKTSVLTKLFNALKNTVR
jgi:hypothetical protein